MKPSKTGYSESFQLPNGGWRKCWHEWEMDETDDPREALYKAKDIECGKKFLP